MAEGRACTLFPPQKQVKSDVAKYYGLQTKKQQGVDG